MLHLVFAFTSRRPLEMPLHALNSGHGLDCPRTKVDVSSVSTHPEEVGLRLPASIHTPIYLPAGSKPAPLMRELRETHMAPEDAPKKKPCPT